jgi:TolB-like protein/Tfp pilus assembly protein PilF
MTPDHNRIARFWQELKRRKVIQVIIVYATAAFIIIELVDIISTPLRLPEWTVAFIIVLLCVGFIMVLILSWIYDIGPEGVIKTESIDIAKEQESPSVPVKRRVKASGVIMAVLIVVAGVLAYPKIFRKDKPEGIGDPDGQISIAVLPFTDMSPDKDQEYFCEGMAEEIINALSHIADLRVVARTSAFSFKGKNMDIREIGNKLNVDAILEGSIRKSGDQLRVTMQLINIEDGYHLWSEIYERKLEDVFAIQDEISLAVVDNLKVKLLKGEKNDLVKRYTENKEAYNLFLQGRYYWNRRTEVGFNKAFDFFNRAIELDPDYALAYAGQAECYCMLSIHEPRPEPFIRRGRMAAEKALSIDETLAEAHAALGFIKFTYDWDWLGSERSFKQALLLNPRYPTANNWYAVLLSILNRHDEAKHFMKQAWEYDPESPIINRDLAVVYAWAGEYQNALDQLRYTIDMDPGFAPAYFFMGNVYCWMKEYNVAIEYYEKVRELTGDFFDITGTLGYAYSKMGNKEAAIGELHRLDSLAKTQNDIRAYEYCLIYAGLKDYDKFYEWLDIAYENHAFGIALMRCEAILWFEDLFLDPRFIEFLTRIGIEI